MWLGWAGQLGAWKGTSLSLLQNRSLAGPRRSSTERARREPAVSVFQAVDLLLASFCQDVMAASFFLPPDR